MYTRAMHHTQSHYAVLKLQQHANPIGGPSVVCLPEHRQPRRARMRPLQRDHLFVGILSLSRSQPLLSLNLYLE